MAILIRIADVDEQIERALKSRIYANNDIVFEYGDKVFFKEKEINDTYKEEWSSPASLLGIQGKVLFLKSFKSFKANYEYANKSIECDNSKIEDADVEDDKVSNDEHISISDKEAMKPCEIENERVKRPSRLRCPDKHRKYCS